MFVDEDDDLLQKVGTASRSSTRTQSTPQSSTLLWPTCRNTTKSRTTRPSWIRSRKY